MSPFRHVVIRASAGTGKTYQLTNRFLGLLCAGVPLDHILAVTFTRKAAGEILDRVIQRLAEAAGDARPCLELAYALGSRELDQTRCLDLLGQVTRNLHRLRIGTLDSFFAQLAGSLSLELGLPPGWSIMDEPQANRLRDSVIAALLQQEGLQELTRLMHVLSKGAAERTVSALIREAVSSLHTLYQETDEPAWTLVAEHRPLTAARLNKLLDKIEAVPVPTQKMATARRVNLEAVQIGDWDALLTKGLAKNVLERKKKYDRTEIPPELYKLFRKLLRHVAAVLFDQLAGQTLATYQLLARYDRLYLRRQMVARAVRFDDVTRFLATGLSELAAERHVFRLDTQLQHLLLDEFQDTSLSQWQVLRLFAEQIVKPAAEAAGRSSFFCVGDRKQAIYGWRGGVGRLMEAVEGQLADVHCLPLDKSFRSSPIIIETVNEIFTQMGRHPNLDRFAPAVANWSSEFPRHDTARIEFPGYASLETAAGGATSDAEAQTAARFLTAAEQIAELTRRAPGASVGVLVRKNAHVAQMIYELRRLHVAASEEGGNPLTDSPAVQVVMSFFHWLDHPGDTVCQYHVACSPLGPIVGLSRHADRSTAAIVASRWRARLVERGYGPVVYDWVRQLAPACNRRDLNRLLQLVDQAYEYQAQATLRGRDFVRSVAGRRVPDPQATPVRVMTVHQAKGLQFDAVVLPDLDYRLHGEPPPVVVGRETPVAPVHRVCRYRNAEVQALLPAELQQLFVETTEQAVWEELCVIYVALTRAIHELRIIVSPSKGNEGSLPKSAAGLIRAALTDGAPLRPKQRAFERGTRQWWDALPADHPAKQPPEAPPPTPLAAPLRWAAPSAETRQDLARQAPSELEGGRAPRLAQVLRLPDADALARGTLLHAWLERIEWLEAGEPADAELLGIAARHGASAAWAREVLGKFRQTLQASAIRGPLHQSFYHQASDAALRKILPVSPPGSRHIQVLREQPILARREGELLAGAVDRLVLIQDARGPVAAEVIDFKTDLLAPDAPLRQRLDFYRPQLEAYRTAVAAMFRLPLERIACRLLWVSLGRADSW